LSCSSSESGWGIFRSQRVNVLPWPSKSPDLNPIEQVWGYMTKFIYKNDFRPQNAEGLQQKIIEAWHVTMPEYITNLVTSMPRRLQSVTY
jgi:transposase